MVKPGILVVAFLAASALAWSGESSPPELERVVVGPDGRGFLAGGEPWAPVGVNYFDPHTGWAPKLWREFDAERVEEHFRQMESLGVNAIRVFTTAASFIPHPPDLSVEALEKFDRLLSIARRHGIRVHPTGPDHWEGTPSWRRGDIFTDPVALDAQLDFWRAFTRRYRDNPVIFAFDLLNEPHVRWSAPGMEAGFRDWLRARYKTTEALIRAWDDEEDAPDSFDDVKTPEDRNNSKSPRLFDYQRYRESIAEAWVERQVEVIRSQDPERLVTVGLIQWSVPVLLGKPSRYSAFRPARIAPLVGFSSVHFYPLNGDPLSSPGNLDANLAYLELVLRCCRSTKPLVLGEFAWYGGGAPDRQPERTLEDQVRWNKALVEQSRGLVAGWLHWAWADTPSSRDITRFSGLVTESGTVKPWGRTFRSLAEELRTSRMAVRRESPPPDGKAFPFDFDQAIRDTEEGTRALRRYVTAWEKARRLPVELEEGRGHE